MTERPPDDVIQARRQFLLDQEASEPEQWWWLSFASEADGFLGVIIVSASGFITAVDQTHWMGINPGGEVQGYPAPPEFEPGDMADRLLSRATLEAEGWV